MSQILLENLTRVFGGDSPIHPLSYGQIAARSVVIYLGGLFLVRIGKSRLLGKTTPLDIILAFVLGSLLSRGITGSASLSGTLVASATLIALHWWMTRLACHRHWLGNIIKGHAHRLVSDGVIDQDAMDRSHVSEQDLFEQMRTNANLDDLSRVKSAYKERSGEIGIVKAPSEPRVIELPVEQGVQRIRIEFGSP